jgi:hypothetical protein
MPHQLAVTVQIPIRAGQTGPLKEFLDEIRADGRWETLFPFPTLPVHFARFVVLDEATDLAGMAIPPSLMFMCDVDARLTHFVEKLAQVAGAGLDQVFAHCQGYPASPGPRERVAFLRAGMIPSAAAYINTVGRSVCQVQDEARLRDAIEGFLDSADWSQRGAGEVRGAVQRFVAGDADLSWALERPARPNAIWRLGELAHMITWAAVALILLPVILVALPFYVIALRLHEMRDVPSTTVADRRHLEQLEAMEDLHAQNQLSAVGFVKPQDFRRRTLAGVLWILSYASRHVYNKGSLSGIKTIHFARWVFLDDQRRLIFISNYDGSIESYMDDFIDKVAYGLNAAFSNGLGYPKTRWLIAGGAKDELAFKNYLRDHQIPTQIWYSAYPTLTARNIANNAAIRAGLRGEMTPAEESAWAARL